MTVIPAQLFDLSGWKLTNDQNVQITDPALLTYTDSNYYVRSAVVFRAHCGGIPVPGSSYARCEYREMNADGSPAAWSTSVGTHTLSLHQRVTVLPPVKPEVVIGQIHNADPQILVTLTGTLLTVRYYKEGLVFVLDTNCRLSQWMDVQIVAHAGLVDVYYNGTLKASRPLDIAGCYFKAGCYVQSSTSTGDLPTSYGEVEVSALTVTHV